MVSSTPNVEKRMAEVFSPIITATAFGVLLTGCGQPAAPVPTDDGLMMRSVPSSEAMMESSSSPDVMMQRSPHGMMRSPSATMYRDGTYGAGGVYASPAGGESVHETPEATR